jgi:hypothetical protein
MMIRPVPGPLLILPFFRPSFKFFGVFPEKTAPRISTTGERLKTGGRFFCLVRLWKQWDGFCAEKAHHLCFRAFDCAILLSA